MVAQLNGFREDVHFIAMFPVNPDIFQSNPAIEPMFVQCFQRAAKINRVFLEVALQTTFTGATGVQMRGKCCQRLDACIRNSGPRKVCRVQCEAKSWHAAHQIQRAFRRVNQRTDVRLDGELQLRGFCVADTPCEFVRTAGNGGRARFVFKSNARQNRDVFRSRRRWRSRAPA